LRPSWLLFWNSEFVALTSRPAHVSDLPTVLDLVHGMFVDLGASEVPATWRADVIDALTTRMGREVAAYVTVDSGGVIAVAVGLLEQRLPSPRRPNGRVGYVEWLATGAANRRRGAARLALEELLAWFDAQDVGVVDVHASAGARSLYERLGFEFPAATALRRRAARRQ
jgi:GNAT superfamily N-acetyltransferase